MAATASDTNRRRSCAARFADARAQIREEYLEPHLKPWVVGFSGGKDSTLLLQLVTESLLSLPPDERNRKVFVLSVDTLVESPVYRDAVDATLERVTDGMKALGLPVSVHVAAPDLSESFWVNLLGRGYPAPNRSFRWCTDRMKIRPTTRFIRQVVDEAGEVILLLGVRRAESSHRAGRLSRYDDLVQGARLAPHNDIQNCSIFKPLVDIANEEVWDYLLQNRPPWGGTHRELVTLYRNARGGECPFVTDKSDTPSCGTGAARFGCWTCTVVEKDSSIEGLIEAGNLNLEPLAEFRDRLRAVSNMREYRSTVRRNGQPGLGPLTIPARKMLLNELLEVQRVSGLSLVSLEEQFEIEAWWSRDEVAAALREFDNVGVPEEEFNGA